MEGLGPVSNALALSAVLVFVWQLTLPREHRTDPAWERCGSAAGLALFLLVAAAVKILR